MNIENEVLKEIMLDTKERKTKQLLIEIEEELIIEFKGLISEFNELNKKRLKEASKDKPKSLSMRMLIESKIRLVNKELKNDINIIKLNETN